MLETEIVKLREAIEALTKAVIKQSEPVLWSVPASSLMAASDAVPGVSQGWPPTDTAPVVTESEQTQVASKVRRKPVDTPPANKTEEIAPAPAPEPEPLRQDITRQDLQDLAMELVRADSAMKNEIKAILAEFGSQTITKLADENLRPVHAKFMAHAHRIAKEGEPV